MRLERLAGGGKAAILLLLPACGAVEMRGGHVVPRGMEPPGRVLMRYEPVGCVDRAGQRTAYEPGTTWLVRVEEGEDVLVSTIPGYDSIVIENEFVARGQRVFQLSVEAGPGRDLLVDYRLPILGEGPGQLAFSRRWVEVRGEPPRVRAYFDQTVLACRLEATPYEEDERAARGTTAPSNDNVAPPPGGGGRKVAPKGSPGSEAAGG